MFLFNFSKRRRSLQWTETSTFIILPLYLQLLFMQKKNDRTVAASFQTKDSILRQLYFVIMYKYILMRVKIIE